MSCKLSLAFTPPLYQREHSKKNCILMDKQYSQRKERSTLPSLTVSLPPPICRPYPRSRSGRAFNLFLGKTSPTRRLGPSYSFLCVQLPAQSIVANIECLGRGPEVDPRTLRPCQQRRCRSNFTHSYYRIYTSSDKWPCQGRTSTSHTGER